MRRRSRELITQLCRQFEILNFNCFSQTFLQIFCVAIILHVLSLPVGDTTGVVGRMVKTVQVVNQQLLKTFVAVTASKDKAFPIAGKGQSAGRANQL